MLLFNNELDEEDRRAMREGLDEESLAIFDLMKKQELNLSDINRIKSEEVFVHVFRAYPTVPSPYYA